LGRRRLLIILSAVTVVIAMLGAGTAVAFNATEKPKFCTSCHEMKPYYGAWATGPHKDVSCVECHVGAGSVARVSHKIVALKEVYDHFTATPTFPRGDAPVRQSACVRCHPRLADVTKSGFSHKYHAKQGSCVSCHADAGHTVSREALASAGILNVASRVGLRLASSAESTAAAHVTISCTRCHDVNKVACSTCHKARHPQRGACTTCHRPGPEWAFTHPSATDCATCHRTPAKHFAGACSRCHDAKTPFASTKYAHRSSACGSCHVRPARHAATSASCASCHRQPGVSWAFSHPASSSCASCHAAPRAHFGSACASCHRLGVAFRKATFRHTSAAVCQQCHRPPPGHNTRGCSSCHRRPGVSWAFSHPSSTRCASCHHAPSRHFGTTCASCHSPRRAWSSATFRHPRVPGGQHTYHSFACSKCHPSGPPRVGCTCHGGGTTGPSGD